MTVLWVGLVAVVLTWPANVMISVFLRLIRAQGTGGSPGAGAWIGILERLIIFMLVVAGEPAAAALVVTAKAILRFPEITGKEPHLDAEYVLIGSLSSWLIALAGGYAAVAII